MRDSVRRLAGQLEPAEGREFYLAVLVRDPDGTGLRDVGTAAGLWPEANDRQAWSRWPGAVWGDQPPRNSACVGGSARRSTESSTVLHAA